MRPLLTFLLLLTLVAQGEWLAFAGPADAHAVLAIRAGASDGSPTRSCPGCECAGRACCRAPESNQVPYSPALPASGGELNGSSLPSPTILSASALAAFPLSLHSSFRPARPIPSPPAPARAPALFLRDCCLLI